MNRIMNPSRLSAILVRLRVAAAATSAGVAVVLALALAPASAGAAGTNTMQIMQATISALPSCLSYKVTGVCFFLRCSPWCTIKTSIKVSHAVPDVIISTYPAPDRHPWTDVGRPLALALKAPGDTMLGALSDAQADTARETSEVVTFKSVDAIGNPIGAIMSNSYGFEFPDLQELMRFVPVELPRIAQQWAAVPVNAANSTLEGARTTALNPGSLLGEIANLPGQIGGSLSNVRDTAAGLSSLGSDVDLQQIADKTRQSLSAAMANAGSSLMCPGGSSMLSIQYHSDLDSLFWRGSIPLELLYPGSWVPGIDEVGNGLINTWGNTYPRTGEFTQPHPRKASAVIAARAASIIRQSAQPHIYKKLSPKGGQVYFKQMADPKYQPIWPIPESRCITFGENDSLGLGSWGDYKTSGDNAYIWNLWHTYECCQRQGAYLFSVP